MPYDLGGQRLRVAVEREVHHAHGYAELPGQYRHRAAAVQDAPHQLVRGTRRPCGDAEFGDPVVTREQQHPGPFDRPHRNGRLRRRQPLTQFVEAAQRPGRHDLPLPPRLGVAAHPTVGALDQIGEVVEIKRAHSPNSTGTGRTVPRHIATTRPGRRCSQDRDPIRSVLQRIVVRLREPP